MNTASADEQHVAASSQPHPPRYWWLKRIALTALCLLLAVGLLRWRVDVIARQRLAERIAAIQATGEPILPEDFNTEPVPDDDNAVPLLKQAAESFTLPAAGTPEAHILFDRSLCATHMAAAERLIEANEEALSLLREARAKPSADWGVYFASPVLDLEFPPLSRHIQLAGVACAAAAYEHARGDHVAAVERLRDVLAYGEHVNALPILLGNLAAIVMGTGVAGTLDEILPELVFTDGEGAANRAALRSELLALQRALLSDEAVRAGLVRAFQSERAMLLDGAREGLKRGITLVIVKNPNVLQRLLARAELFLFGPIYRADTVRMLDWMTAQIELSRFAVGATEAEPKPVSPDVTWSSVLNRETRFLSALLLPNFTGTIERAAKDLSKRRLAAAAIAVRLYELDHHRRPASLDELVPEYLPYVPIDTFSPTGEPILYVPSGAEPRLELRLPLRTGGQGEAASRELVVFHLWPFPPEAAPAAQPGSEEGVHERDGVEHEPRQADAHERHAEPP
jgi:hypothetical protein